MQAQLPALLVVVPLLAAPVCALVRSPAFAWGFAIVVSAASFVVALALAAAVADGSEIAYLLGGWAAPWGIEYRIDALNALVVVIVAGASTVSLAHARLSVAREVRRERIGLFYTAWLLCLTGMLGIAITGDVFNVFVFLEIASLSTYVLVALGPGPAALLAAFRYLVLGSIGATFFLVGIGLLYMMTGTLNMADLSARIGDVDHTRTVAAGVAFVVLGIGLKAAVFPLHAWLPAAYAQAPSSAAAFLAGTSTKVSIYVLVRFLFDLFGVDLAFERLGFGVFLVPLAIAGVLIGSAVAVFQGSVKRLLAWSSIAQLGYMVLGLGLGTAAGVAASLLHLFNHAVMKVALFLAIGNLVFRVGSDALENLAGLGRRMPWTMGAMLVAAMSIVGVPLTAGFVSKWYLLRAALADGMWPIAVVILVSSLLAAVYMWRVVSAAFFIEARPDTVQAHAHEAHWTMVAPVVVLAIANVWFGVETSFSVGFAELAGAALLESPP
ncbi:MAG: monovalent cation/H+ antiporter subunit D family protein [Gammaproteobacteria bacterium]|nr:monovalent cation/H+ antiporter subunit D family protein [Gammaproteobacteria bacterium]